MVLAIIKSTSWTPGEYHGTAWRSQEEGQSAHAASQSCALCSRSDAPPVMLSAYRGGRPLQTARAVPLPSLPKNVHPVAWPATVRIEDRPERRDVAGDVAGLRRSCLLPARCAVVGNGGEPRVPAPDLGNRPLWTNSRDDHGGGASALPCCTASIACPLGYGRVCHPEGQMLSLCRTAVRVSQGRWMNSLRAMCSVTDVEAPRTFRATAKSGDPGLQFRNLREPTRRPLISKRVVCFVVSLPEHG
jgi:hypothetical protein